jgi:hypothetical protein
MKKEKKRHYEAVRLKQSKKSKVKRMENEKYSASLRGRSPNQSTQSESYKIESEKFIKTAPSLQIVKQ